ncbi:MAG TPA: tripartite tricarboxylate transporter substrate binding protein [Burkholderiales bacterium]|nr:tripartite tricarboxylate transporter substrate binding protein [Burkholderiales bacterium]
MLRFLTATLAAAACLLPQAAPAQDYPAREIRSLCNYAPGSGADIIVRFYSDRLSKLAGKAVIVENRVGANGALATDALAKSKPDGYTILITPASATIVSAPYMFKSLPFDSAKDFAAVTTIASLSFVILVDAGGPIRSIPDLVAHLRAKPGESFYGATSNTGVIAAELFKTAAGVKTTYVPYKQNVQALTDLLIGQLDFISFDATWALGQAKAGKLRILAATAAKRSTALPDVPTLAELGFGGNDVSPWWGVVVAAGTPRPVVDKLAGWFNQITSAEDTRQFLANSAFDPFPGSPEQMQSLMKSDAQRWKHYVELAKIEPQ